MLPHDRFGRLDHKGLAWVRLGIVLGYLNEIDLRLVLTFDANCGMLCLQ
jgi:hypothetical protein